MRLYSLWPSRSKVRSTTRVQREKNYTTFCARYQYNLTLCFYRCQIHTAMYTVLEATNTHQGHLKTWNTHSCINTAMIKKYTLFLTHPHPHTYAATYICWIRRILHGWLPGNTDENLDWAKLPALMKTNYLDDSQVCWYVAGKFNSTPHCTRSTRSSSAGNTKLTVAVLFPLQQKCNRTIRRTQTLPQPVLKKVKGQPSISLRRIM